MSVYAMPEEGPWARRGRTADGPRGPERHRGPWYRRGEQPEDPHEPRDHHEHHERHRRGPGHHGGPFGPGGPFGFGGPGSDFGFGGPRGPRGRGRGRAGRGDVRAAILALLAEEPRNGYQIIQEIEQRTDGVWRASSGSVYPALAQLEDEGLIEPVGEGRKLFTLTAEGRAHAEQNAQQLGRIWQDAVGGPDSRFEEFLRHRELVEQLILAYKQVTQVGNGAQRDEARAVLVRARQSLYKILAADEAAPGVPHDGA